MSDELASIVVQRGEQDLHAQSIEAPDPTSLEFEAHFTKLMAEALEDEQRKLVLVIDNLDRIEPVDAVRIWSTLRTFLDHNADSSRASWLERLWIVVPHDPVGIRRMWKDEARIADSVLEKSIQIRFDVPPPLLPDWKRYAVGLLSAAVTGSEQEYHAIYRLIAVLRPFPGRAPTPRILKSIINSIVALRIQSAGEIPLVHIAYYALLRAKAAERSGHAILEQLLDGTLPGELEAGLLTDGAAESLSAIVFGVDPIEARYLLLRPAVETALTEGNGATLSDLAKRFPEIFTVIEAVLHEAASDWRPKEPEKILHAAHALDESGMLDSAPVHEASTLRSILLRNLDQVEALLPAGVGLEAWQQCSAGGTMTSLRVGCMRSSFAR